MKNHLAIATALILLNLLVYAQVGGFDFINLDDRKFVHVYPHLDTGIGPEGIRHAFLEPYLANYTPISTLSYHLDYILYEIEGSGFHLTNLLFHVLNSILLYLVLFHLTRALWPAAFAAVLFAIHPLHVESVAWVAERRDVLFMFFGLPTIGAYAQYARTKKIYWYALALFLFTLSLLSKSMLVTLPFVLLLLDVWPLNRINIADTDRNRLRTSVRRCVIEKIPMFAVVLVIGLITYNVQQQAGAVKAEGAFPLLIRIENAVSSYAIYLWQTLVPVGLIPLYPHPRHDINHAIVLFSLAILIGISALAWRARKSTPPVLVGWLIFIGTLVPVIGFIQIGSQAHADRYMYFPMIGLSIMLFWPLHEWLTRKERIKEGSIALAVLMAVYAGLAWNQTSHWRDSSTLWQYTLQHSPENRLAHEAIALDYISKGDDVQGAAHLTKSLTIRHDRKVMDILGKTYRRMGRPKDAEIVYSQLIKRYPNVAVLWTRVAASIVEQGRASEATPYFQKSLDLMGENIETHAEIGNMYLQLENYAMAEREFQWVLQELPKSAKYRTKLGIALLNLEQPENAINEFETVLDQDPELFDAWLHLAYAHEIQNDIEASITACEKALQLDPNSTEAQQLLETLTTNQ